MAGFSLWMREGTAATHSSAGRVTQPALTDVALPLDAVVGELRGSQAGAEVSSHVHAGVT